MSNFIYNWLKNYLYEKNTAFSDTSPKKNYLIVKHINPINPSYFKDYLTSFWNAMRNYLHHKKESYDDFIIACPICLDKQKEIALIPCGHTLCRQCRVDIIECPICRSCINGYIKIYL